MTLNGDHMVTDMIELCGGVNVFANAAALVPYVNIELLWQQTQILLSQVETIKLIYWTLDFGVNGRVFPRLNISIYTRFHQIYSASFRPNFEGTGLLCEYIDLVRSLCH